ncbi:hypothetical protein [Amycolatopsis benzoatilytica]|uniref:hypothetical protein n=1 Tax=Amycolatopsis benzoatilytica TaxID=346045 RepID=UPI00036A31BA|nr:hypothetical protein [Amycolatopsis benzoatilytica]
MPTNLTKQGLPRPASDLWRSYLEEWDRSLRADNKPHTTRCNYELAVSQLADFLAERGGQHLQPSGIKIMLRRRGQLAGIPHMHAHRPRHILSHNWQLA